MEGTCASDLGSGSTLGVLEYRYNILYRTIETDKNLQWSKFIQRFRNKQKTKTYFRAWQRKRNHRKLHFSTFDPQPRRRQKPWNSAPGYLHEEPEGGKFSLGR